MAQEMKDNNFLMRIFSDEANFNLNGNVNNTPAGIQWAEKNIKQKHERLLRSPKFVVWAVRVRDIIELYFFEDLEMNRKVNTANCYGTT